MSFLLRTARFSSCLSLFFVFPFSVEASIILSEIQVSGDKAADEFVELYNTGSDSVDLDDYSLRRKSQSDVTAKGSSLKTFGSSDIIPAQGYFLWASSGGIFKDLADTTTTGGLSDNNSLGLFDAGGNLIESLTWGSGHTLPFSVARFDNPGKKESLTRDLNDLSWSKTKQTSPTNFKGETWKEESPPEPTPFKSVVINEVFPNPKEKDDIGEFIELYNPLSEEVDLSAWEIHDASTSGKYTFPSGKKIGSKEYLVITDEDFTLSLNNSKETLTLLDAEKHVVHSVGYDKTKEGITLNLVREKLRGGKMPTPGKENILNNDPVIKERVPKKGYRDIPVKFSAKGKDSDGDELKYTWDFGDKHKSYKVETIHTYKETGKYTITLTTDDGTDTATETFEIKIEKYEAPKLRIVALMPNPKGNDSDFEWIEIENQERKTVDLEDFGIATGSKRKSITNHPIKERVEIKGKSVKRITRKDASFTLNNSKGYVELRAPNGEVIHDFKYKFEQSLKEGVVLKKEKGKALVVEETVSSEDASVEKSNEEVSPETPSIITENPPTSSKTEEAVPQEVKGVSTVEEPTPLTHLNKNQAKIFSWLSPINTFLNALLMKWGW